MVHWQVPDSLQTNWAENCAYLQDFVVTSEHRSRGIGTAMIDEAERLAQEKGILFMSVGVGVENAGARVLYERLGYQDSGLPPIDDEETYIDRQGREVMWRETWSYMVKKLTPAT